jgi:hypothetical protein
VAYVPRNDAHREAFSLGSWHLWNPDYTLDFERNKRKYSTSRSRVRVVQRMPYFMHSWVLVAAGAAILLGFVRELVD